MSEITDKDCYLSINMAAKKIGIDRSDILSLALQGEYKIYALSNMWPLSKLQSMGGGRGEFSAFTIRPVAKVRGIHEGNEL